MRLDNPLLVRWEYASEERLAKRNAIFRALIQGDNAEEATFDAVREFAPRTVLDVGCGPGDLTTRLAAELGAAVRAIDISPRMVELTRERGIDTELGDVQSLAFADGEFDCVLAAWVLYHASDLDLAIAECARVLRPGGRLVASTVSADNLSEVWELVGAPERSAPTFNGVDGGDRLRRHFARVEQRDVEGALVFPNAEAMRTFVASTIDRAHLAPKVPEFRGTFRATVRHTVFVAEKAT